MRGAWKEGRRGRDAFDGVWSDGGIRRGFMETQRKAGITSHGEFDELEVHVLMAKIVNGDELEESLKRLVVITQSDWFDNQTMQFDARFIEVLRDFVRGFREGSVESEVIVVVLQLLTNIWYMNRFDKNRIDEELINEVVMVGLMSGGPVMAWAFACMANLAGYMPELFWEYLRNMDMINLICRTLDANESGLILNPVLRFLISEARTSRNELLNPIVPHLPRVLDHTILEIKGLAAALICELIDNDEQYEMFLEQETLVKLFDTLAYSDASRTMPIFACFVVFLRRGVMEVFIQEEFMKQLQSALSQVFTIRADYLFLVIHELVARGQSQCLYENGVIETMIATAPRMIFWNRKMAVMCINEFLADVPRDVRTKVAKEGAFRLICDVIPALSDSEMLPMMKLCLEIVENDILFSAIASTTEVVQALETWNSPDDEMGHVRDMLVKAVQEGMTKCDQSVFAELERIERESLCIDDGDVSNSDEP